MKEETRLWMEANVGTSVTWTEDEIMEQYTYTKERDLEVTEAWCRIMMAGLLGTSAAMVKYPELYI